MLNRESGQTAFTRIPYILNFMNVLPVATGTWKRCSRGCITWGVAGNRKKSLLEYGSYVMTRPGQPVKGLLWMGALKPPSF